jgi:hypothetical protein
MHLFVYFTFIILMSERRGLASLFHSFFFFTIKDDIFYGSLLKDELLGDYSGFFYGLHPAFIHLGRSKNIKIFICVKIKRSKSLSCCNH